MTGGAAIGHAADGGTRYLVSKAWGFGFFSDVFVTLSHLLLAELTGRTPVVHWGANSLFAKPGHDNAFTLFFEPPNPLVLRDLARGGLRFFPDKWRADNLGSEDLNKWSGSGSRMAGHLYLDRREEVVVCDFHTAVVELLDHLPAAIRPRLADPVAVYRRLVSSRLRPRRALLDGARDEYRRLIGGHRAVAVHFRGTDKLKELDNVDDVDQLMAPFIEETRRAMTELGLDRVFLLTDDTRAIDAFAAVFGERLVHTETARSSGMAGVHYARPGHERGLEAMLDVLIALRCDAFVGMGLSNLSCFVFAARPWGERGRLLGGNLMRIRNDFVQAVDASRFERNG